jgi:pilus assembly protein CpaB
VRGLGGGVRLLGEGRRGAWRRRVVRRGLSAALAGVAVLGGVAVARTPEGGPHVTVLVATRDLPAGHEVGASDLEVQHRPSGFAPATPLQHAGRATGLRLAGPVGAGEVLTAARVVGSGLLDGQPAGTRAVHVPVTDPGALAMVQAGDSVDLVASTGQTLAREVTVLSVGSASADGAGGLSGMAGAGGGIVAAVDGEQVARLASAPPDAVGGAGVTVVLRGSPSLP